MRVAFSIWVLGPAIAVCAGLSACSSTIHKQARFNGVDSLSVDAKQRLVLFGNRLHQDPVTQQLSYVPTTCAEPSPDAIVAMSAAIAARGSATLPTPPAGSSTAGKDNFAAGAGFSSSESAASIAMRTASIEVLRDGYYRLCEGLLNGSISEEKYRQVIHGIGDFIVTVMAVDALGGTKRAPAVVINGGSVTASAQADIAKADVTGASGAEAGQPAQGLVIGSIVASVPADGQAEAIKNVIFSYLDNAEYMRKLQKKYALKLRQAGR